MALQYKTFKLYDLMDHSDSTLHACHIKNKVCPLCRLSEQMKCGVSLSDDPVFQILTVPSPDAPSPAPVCETSETLII